MQEIDRKQVGYGCLALAGVSGIAAIAAAKFGKAYKKTTTIASAVFSGVLTTAGVASIATARTRNKPLWTTLGSTTGSIPFPLLSVERDVYTALAATVTVSDKDERIDIDFENEFHSVSFFGASMQCLNSSELKVKVAWKTWEGCDLPFMYSIHTVPGQFPKKHPHKLSVTDLGEGKGRISFAKSS